MGALPISSPADQTYLLIGYFTREGGDLYLGDSGEFIIGGDILVHFRRLSCISLTVSQPTGIQQVRQAG